ncbi:Solute carrier family 15 member 4 [Chionoecetes opilio]|uniref:Solute carrier family 15 member 4 n=1 Tax=Chionoecetes opilio TaxID=41210 RepID=A0A8J4YWZ1_CHIOP|nr:Solute carrier family 15 member 4 [Chionoecetes opilio]
MPNEQTPLLSRHPSAMDAREGRRQSIATGVILLVLTLERLAYYALATNFFLFLNKGPWDGPQAWDSLEAMNAVFVLAGVSYISALLGGYISDAWLGRFKTMVGGFLLYISGYVLLTLMAVDKLPSFICPATYNSGGGDATNHAPCKAAVYISVTIVGLGVGTVKSNIAPFGAEQLNTANPQKTRSFFNWFYWCINLGSLVGVSVIAYIQQDSPGVCTNGFFCGYLIASECPPEELSPQDIPPEELSPQDIPPEELSPQDIPPEELSPQDIPPEELSPQNVHLKNCHPRISHLKNCHPRISHLKNCHPRISHLKNCHPRISHLKNRHPAKLWVCLVVALVVFVAVMPCYQVAPPEGSVLGNIARIFWEALTAKVRHWRYPQQDTTLSPLRLEPRFLDRAKIRYGGSFHESAVDDVRSLGRLLAVFIALIPYWLVYFQMETSFQAQGLHMRFTCEGGNYNTTNLEDETPINVSLGNKFSVPAAWLTLFNQLFLIGAIPVLTTFLYPVMDRAGIRLSMLFRIGIGMVFSILAVMVAGGLESYRIFLWRTDNSSHIEQVVGNVTYHAVDISIFWQVPQYVLVGAAELFASIAGLEFAYSAAPRTFQGMIMGLFYTLEGVGSLLGTTLLHLVSPFWLANTTDYGNINDNHLDFYLYFLGVLQFTPSWHTADHCTCRGSLCVLLPCPGAGLGPAGGFRGRDCCRRKKRRKRKSQKRRRRRRRVRLKSGRKAEEAQKDVIFCCESLMVFSFL